MNLLTLTTFMLLLVERIYCFVGTVVIAIRTATTIDRNNNKNKRIITTIIYTQVNLFKNPTKALHNRKITDTINIDFLYTLFII